jgi:hypothetical protein
LILVNISVILSIELLIKKLVIGPHGWPKSSSQKNINKQFFITNRISFMNKKSLFTRAGTFLTLAAFSFLTTGCSKDCELPPSNIDLLTRKGGWFFSHVVDKTNNETYENDDCDKDETFYFEKTSEFGGYYRIKPGPIKCYQSETSDEEVYTWYINDLQSVITINNDNVFAIQQLNSSSLLLRPIPGGEDEVVLYFFARQ